MLYMIGPITIDVFPYNVEDVKRDRESEFAEKAVIGRRPPLQHVGEKSDTLSMTGKVLPTHLPGGLEMHEALHAVRSAAMPQLVIRGDGEILGWFVITKAAESHSMLDPSGVGFQVEISIELKRDDPPDASAFAGLFASLFG